jgi:4-amino-4-deoxy-L-arabinose transferase-like glycosyltransferase
MTNVDLTIQSRSKVQFKYKQFSKYFWIIATLFVVIHGGLFIHGILDPEALMKGDRAGGRLKSILYVFDGEDTRGIVQGGATEVTGSHNSSFLGRMVESGDPGDYIFQGLLLTRGGVYSLIALQLLLSFLASIAVFYLAMILGLPAQLALIATILYMLLPGSLISPHQLSSEALYNPLVVIGFVFLIKHVEERSRGLVLTIGIALLALAILVRPQLLLYPFLLILILRIFDAPNWRRKATEILLICFILPIAWGLFVHGKTGDYNLGGINYGRGFFFNRTAERMALVGGFEIESSHSAETKMSLGRFSRYVLDHPVAFVQLKSMDFLNVILNPGTYSLAVHHLGFWTPAGDTSFWVVVRDQEGLSGTMAEIFRRGRGFFTMIVGGVIAWGLVLIGAVVGGIVFWRDARSTTATKAILFSCLFYGLLVVLISNTPRWGHRTPIEFLIVILFVLGMDALASRMKRIRCFRRNSD